MKVADDINYAIKFGTTLNSRLFLALAATFQGAGYLIRAPASWASPIIETIDGVLSLQWWGVLYLTAGILGVWRVLDPVSRPRCGFIVNMLVFAVYVAGLAARLLLGAEAALSFYTIFPLVAFWVLLRTEATHRDSNTA